LVISDGKARAADFGFDFQSAIKNQQSAIPQSSVPANRSNRLSLTTFADWPGLTAVGGWPSGFDNLGGARVEL
jgi:hypothetical protein